MEGVSIIIPLYNKESTVVSTIEKALVQTCPNFEVIVVDDGSTDGSVTLLEQFKDKIKVIHQVQKGPSAARNAGARQANYSVYAFLDADDYISEYFVERHLAVRKSHPEIKLSMNSFDVLDQDALLKRELLFNRFDTHDGTSNVHLLSGFNSKLVTNIHSGGFCVDKDLFETCSGFDEKLRCWEITDALTKFSLATHEKAILNDILSFKFEGDQQNSQFFREKNNLEPFRIYCRNIIEYLPKVEGSSKQVYFSVLNDLCIMLWHAKQWCEMARTYIKIKHLHGAEDFFFPLRKISIAVSILKFFRPSKCFFKRENSVY